MRRRKFMTAVGLLAICISGAAQTGYTIIDGKSNPDSIPDATAYSMMFNMLKPGTTEGAGAYARRTTAYAKWIGLGEVEQQVFLKIVQNFLQRSREFDDRARAARSRNMGAITAQTRSELKAIDEERVQMCAEMGALLTSQIGPAGKTKLEQHLQTRVKPNTRMYVPR